MGLTRSEIAVVLVAHGERGGDFSNGALHAHAEAVRVTGGFAAVASGVLNGTPAFEDALALAAASAARRILVYPFFMADGYFTNRVVPKRIADAGLTERCRVLTPLGLDPGLPQLLLAEALATAARAGLDPAASRLLVVGHGSKGPRASIRATEEVAALVAGEQRFQSVATAFLEEPPFLDDMLVGRRPPTVVVGFFSGDGLHASEDVPEAIAAMASDAVYTGAIGSKPGVDGLIVAAVLVAAAHDAVALRGGGGESAMPQEASEIHPQPTAR
ncbi:MAG: CbiX/SirB N-terminal domain-containing protein [Pseudomonadota bacterium]